VARAKADGIQPGEKIRVGGKEMPLKEIGDTPAGLAKVKDYRAAVGRQMHKTGEYDTRNPEKKSNPFDARTDGHNPHKQAMRMAGASRANKIEKARAQGMPAEFQTQYEGDDGTSMSPKQKSFASLAPPTDKITFADKIAGAKKEVDEMLGDVAAEAMKNAVGKMGANSHQAKTTMKHVNTSNASSKVKSAIGKASADIEPGAQGYRSRAAALTAAGIKGAPGEVAEEDNSPFTAHKRPRAERPKVGSVERGALHDIEHTATGRKVTRRVDPNTGHSVGADDDTPASGEKRGRGRPAGKGAGKSIGAKGPSGTSKLMKREGEHDVEDQGEYDQEGDMAKDDIKTIVRHAQALSKVLGDNDNLPEWVQSKLAKIESMMISIDEYMQNQAGDDEEEPIAEKATSKKQQKFMGMVHAAQKGAKPASKEVGKVAKTMKKGDAEDFAATKHKGLPEKAKSKKKEVDETTVSGAVATGSGVAKDSGTPKATKSGGSMQYGKGVYESAIAESFNKKLNNLLNEGMSISMNVGEDGKQSLTVNATDEDAVQLAQLLKMAGLGGSGESCSSCGQAPCGCDHIDEELANSPSPGYSDTDTMVNTLSGGLNGRKSTGQTTAPIVNRDPRRGSLGAVAESNEKRLWELYNRYDRT
jgi:hypothetical protein